MNHSIKFIAVGLMTAIGSLSHGAHIETFEGDPFPGVKSNPVARTWACDPYQRKSINKVAEVRAYIWFPLYRNLQ